MSEAITVKAGGVTTITASASGGSISASVGSQSVAVTVGGGIGPPGAAVSNLGDLADVDVNNLAAGDVLRRDGTTWTNYPTSQLLDGGSY